MIAFDEYNLIRTICQQSFYEFVREFWEEIVPDAYIANWHIPYICHQIQKEVELVLARKPKRYDYIIINVPPGSTKSTIMMEMLNAWIWCRMPSAGFIGCSYERDLAVDKARVARILVKSPKYQRCFPEVEIAKDMDSKGTFATSAKGARYSSGTSGTIIGLHGDIIVVDDPLNPRAARSDAILKGVKEFILEALPSRKRQKHITPTFIIMQRLAQEDTTGMLLSMAKEDENIRIKHICLPATTSALIRPTHLVKYYKEGLLDPVRMPQKVLSEQKALLGDYGYAGQYDQSPIPTGGGLFRTDNILMGKSPPNPDDPKKWVKQVRYWDKAATYDDGCWTVGVRMGKDTDQTFWILHVDRFRLEPTAREHRMRHRAEMDGSHVVIVVEQEPGSGGKESALGSVRNLAGYRVMKDRPTGNKEDRADPFAAQVNGGNVRFAPERFLKSQLENWHMHYLEELQYFPYSKYKDQVDASSGAFNQLVSSGRRVGFGFGLKT